MTTFTPAERWPFVGGEAVYYLPSNQSYIRPTTFIPAIVLSCYTLRSAPMGCSKASIQRADKSRPSNVSAGRLVYRGYCAACEVPAIEGTGGALICPQCLENAIALPPPDHLVVRWYPLGEWLETRMMRYQIQHPTWSWHAAREASDEVLDRAYEGMLARLKLSRLYRSHGSSTGAVDWKREDRALETLKAAALLGDDALFLATHQELHAYQAKASRSSYLAQRLLSLNADQLETLLDLASGDPPQLCDEDGPPPNKPPAVSLIPLPDRPEGDDAPDGEDEMTRWLEQQFTKKKAA